MQTRERINIELLEKLFVQDEEMKKIRENVMDLDWKMLIVLDSCRYDTFKKINDIEGKLRPVYSLGSTSAEWIRKTIVKKHDNLIYISACPYVVTHIKKFGYCEMIDVLKDGFDEELHTVLPEKVNEAFLNLKYDPKKRYILHYMQPHHPFLGKNGIKATGFTQWKYGTVLGEAVWDLIRNEKISLERAKRGYESCLEFVLEYIKELLSSVNIEGKVAITGDHGQVFGEYGLLGHPEDSLTFDEVIKVPYLEVDKKWIQNGMVSKPKGNEGIIGYAFVVGDLLHYGHMNFLRQCKLYCDFLIIGVFTDELTMQYKRKPVIPFKQRMETIKGLRMVDMTIKVNKRDQTYPMKRLAEAGWKIKYLFHGTDWSPEKDQDLKSAKEYIESIGGKLIQPPYTEGISTSLIIEKILRRV